MSVEHTASLTQVDVCRFLERSKMKLADLPLDLLRLCLQNLSLLEVVTFDFAILNHEFRDYYLCAISGLELLDINFYLSPELIHWIMARGVLVKDIPIANDSTHLLDLIEYSQHSLRSINLSHTRIVEDVLIAFLNECSNLVSINLRSCSELTDGGVQSLCEAKRNLQNLNISKCPQLTSGSIVAIAECCPQLQDLNISSLHFVSDEEVKWILQGCSKLRKINLSSTKITNASVEAAIQSCPQLQSMSFLHCERVTNEAFRLLISQVFYPLVLSSDPADQLLGTLQLGNFFATAAHCLNCLSLPDLISRLLTFLSADKVPELQVEVCEILCSLPNLYRSSPNIPGAQLLAHSGAIPPLLRLLTSPHPEVVQHATHSLSLCARYTGSCALIPTDDALAQLLALRKRHPSRADLFLSVMQTLLEILPTKSLVHALPALLELLHEQPVLSLQCLSKSCKILHKFLSSRDDSSARLTVLRLGFLPRILNLLRTTDQPKQQPDALFVHDAFELLDSAVALSSSHHTAAELAQCPDVFATIFQLLSLRDGSLYSSSVSKCLLAISRLFPGSTLATLLSDGFLPLLFEHNDANTVSLLTTLARRSGPDGRDALLQAGLLHYLLGVAAGRKATQTLSPPQPQHQSEALEVVLLLLRSLSSADASVLVSKEQAETVSLLKRKLQVPSASATDIHLLRLVDLILEELTALQVGSGA